MAIDTRDRRASAYAVGLPWMVVPPEPDGSLEAVADRVHLMGWYRGLVPDGAAGPHPAIAALGGLREAARGGIRAGAVGGVRAHPRRAES